MDVDVLVGRGGGGRRGGGVSGRAEVWRGPEGQ